MPVLASFLVAVIICAATSAFGAFSGDCDGSGTVTIAEVQNAVNMNLDPGLADICVDIDEDGIVTQSEVQLVVDAFLGPVSLPVGIVGQGAYVVEGDSAPKSVSLRVRLTKAYEAQVSIDWATADGTALAGSDYVQNSGTVIFAVGETEKTIPLQIIGDSAVEPNPREIFKVLFSNPGGAPLATPSIFVTIEDDDRTTIGASGGIARIGVGAVTIHALAGALAADTTFSATSAADADPLIVGAAYTILPAATSFTARTTLAITYPNLSPSLPASELTLARWDGNAWLPLPGSHVDTTAQTVSAGIDATGIYAVIDGRNKSLNIAYVVETPAAANEFTTVAAATTYVCTQQGRGRVIIRRSPVTIGSFSPLCAASLEREEATPVTIAGATTVSSASPISFSGFTFGGVVTFTAGSDLTLRNNQFASTVDIFLDPSPPAAAAAPIAFFAPSADGCSHSGTVNFSGNTSAGPLSLSVVGGAGYCGNTNVSDSLIPSFSVSAATWAKMTGEARLDIERLQIDELIVNVTAEGNARAFLGEVNAGKMIVQKDIAAGISGPRVDMMNVDVTFDAALMLKGGGSLRFSNKGIRIRKEYSFELLDGLFQGEVHGDIGASTLGAFSAGLGGSGIVNLVDGVSIEGRADYKINEGLRDGIVDSCNTSYGGGVSVDASKLPLNLPFNLSVSGGKCTDVTGTVGIVGIGIGIPLGSPVEFAPAAAPAAPATPVGLNIDGFNINSGSTGLAALKNGIHIDLENRTDPIEIKNTTFSVGQASAIVVQNAKGTVLIEGNTVTDANVGIMLENIAGQVTIDTNAITSDIGIYPGNNVQLTTITNNTISAGTLGLNLFGTSSVGSRRTTATGNIISVPGGMALSLMSQTILDFRVNMVVGDINATAWGYTAAATITGNSIQGQLADNPMIPVLTSDPGGQGMDPEVDIATNVDWTGNGCADYPPSLDQKDEFGVCLGEDGLSPAVAPL